MQQQLEIHSKHQELTLLRVPDGLEAPGERRADWMRPCGRAAGGHCAGRRRARRGWRRGWVQDGGVPGCGGPGGRGCGLAGGLEALGGCRADWMQPCGRAAGGRRAGLAARLGAGRWGAWVWGAWGMGVRPNPTAIHRTLPPPSAAPSRCCPPLLTPRPPTAPCPVAPTSYRSLPGLAAVPRSLPYALSPLLAWSSRPHAAVRCALPIAPPSRHSLPGPTTLPPFLARPHHPPATIRRPPTTPCLLPPPLAPLPPLAPSLWRNRPN
uniref:Uncharacterized protein n=1 Tax=Setaria viridis TaxID=4556 RepID=A0A4V6DB44_SETVI|nr:hypothetical protein SEVIR_2G153000v2 [Setaria viridis]